MLASDQVDAVVLAAPHTSHSEQIITALVAYLPTSVNRSNILPYLFACPAGVMRADGLNSGCAEVMSPWGDAVTERASL